MQRFHAPREGMPCSEPAATETAAVQPLLHPAPGVAGTWHGLWGGRAVRLRLAQFDALVVGDLSIEGLQLRVAGGVDEFGTLGWTSSQNVDPAVCYRTGSSGWRLEPHTRLPVLRGGLQRHQVHQVHQAGAGTRQESVMQFEASLTPEPPRQDRAASDRDHALPVV